MRAAKVRQASTLEDSPYGPRHAAYDLLKLRGKQLIERTGNTGRYRAIPMGIRILSGMLILRDKVIEPVLNGAAIPRPGPRPKNTQPLDQHYANLPRELRATFLTLGINTAA